MNKPVNITIYPPNPQSPIFHFPSVTNYEVNDQGTLLSFRTQEDSLVITTVPFTIIQMSEADAKLAAEQLRQAQDAQAANARASKIISRSN